MVSLRRRSMVVGCVDCVNDATLGLQQPSQVGGCVTIPPVLVSSSSFMCLLPGRPDAGSRMVYLLPPGGERTVCLMPDSRRATIFGVRTVWMIDAHLPYVRILSVCTTPYIDFIDVVIVVVIVVAVLIMLYDCMWYVAGFYSLLFLF